ncbi:ATP-binding protein [Weissella bombi]|uniref:Histidine kinase-, DNA gyrase B-, and HSP90-like ATPase n=1 Tax=Weissella bombi TaxID=1505725 RepID=A0A1C4C6B8_9LACO|nr:ATP-binding protein [Weissella bombi]SCC14660.1 Histidine kinase-, DNA gyrase B-, and HSP90-like ATPase [Weissella bombi]
MTQLFKVSNVTMSGTLKMINELYNISDDNIQLDFSKMYKVRMDGMILFIKAIKDLRKKGKKFWPMKEADYWHEGRPAINYAAHVGFFKGIGIDYGNDVGEATPSSRFVPITVVTESNLYQLSKMGDLHIGIETYSESLAKVLTDNSTLKKIYAYLIREMVRNPFEHSTTDQVWIAAQVHPTEEYVEVVISDDGEGIRQTLKINKDFKDIVEDDEHAVRYALKPGISGKKYAHKTGGNWDNSGFGLYVTSRLTEKYGDFLLGSGNFLIEMNNTGEKVYKETQLQIKGTFIRLQLNTEIMEDIDQKIISEIVSEGEAESKNIDGAIQSASKASKMIDLTK